jgi:predicted secreted protein
MAGRGRSLFNIATISLQTEENHEDLSLEGEIFRNINLIITKSKRNSGVYIECFCRKSQYFGI